MWKIIKRMPFWATSFAILFLLTQIAMDLYLPSITADMINNGVMPGNTSYIWEKGYELLAFSIFSLLGALVNVFLASKISHKLALNLRSDIFAKVTHFSEEDFNKFGSASLITRTTNDVTQVQTLIDMGLKFLILAPMYLIGATFMAHHLNAELSSIFWVVLPILLGIALFIMYFAAPMYGKLQKKVDQMNLIFREGLTGLKVIRSFHKGDYEFQRFQILNQDYTNASIRVNLLSGAMMPLMMVVMGIANISILWIGGHYILEQGMGIGIIAAFMTYSIQILIGFMLIAMTFSTIPRGQTSAKRINEILEIKPSIVDIANPIPIKIDDTTTLLEFDAASFNYPGAEKNTLSDINFQLNKGETLGIIGGTGSGKSTLAQLISRLYDVKGGDIKLYGTSLKQLHQSDLHQYISYVPQKSLLFSGTIRDNMLLGNPGATDNEIWEILEIAQAKNFINKLPDRLDSIVEQGGKNFSGGQRQRLCIARALIKKASIYIFDDSFSALDYKTDVLVRTAMAEKLADAGVILISQRINTIKNAQNILVLHQGKIAGIGNHEQQMQNSPIYQEIYDSQFNKENL